MEKSRFPHKTAGNLLQRIKKSVFAADQSSYIVENIGNFPGGSRCYQADNHIDNQCNNECRQQLIDGKSTAQSCNAKLPDEYHHTACYHACQCAVQIGTLPEQSQQDNRAKGGTKTSPCKGYNAEYGAVWVTCQEYGNDRNHNNGDTGSQNALLLGQLDAEQILQQVLGEAGGSSQQLGVRSGHGSCQNTCQNQTANSGSQNTVLTDELCNVDDDTLGILQSRQGADLGHSQTNNADENGNSHGNDNPDGCNTAGS